MKLRTDIRSHNSSDSKRNRTYIFKFKNEGRDKRMRRKLLSIMSCMAVLFMLVLTAGCGGGGGGSSSTSSGGGTISGSGK
jgi:hypothetical protein